MFRCPGIPVRLTTLGVLVTLFLVSIGFSASAQSKEEVTVAAAADLNDALKEIVVAFRKQTGTRVNVVIGSSGNLYSQIQNGAPFDVFMSADTDYPLRLIAERRAKRETFLIYGVGRLVLMARSNSPFELRDIAKVLKDEAVRKVAIANPSHAPYGRAAVEALRGLDVFDRVAPKLVLGENVGQAAQFVESGNAQVGFVALARVLAPAVRGKAKYIEVPSDVYTTIKQAAVVLNAGSDNPAALAFVRFVGSPAAAPLWKKYGFGQADGPDEHSGVEGVKR